MITSVTGFGQTGPYRDYLCQAFEDFAGAEGSERIYGSFARNAHLWDLE